jgi:hypothetical protein
VTKIVIDAGSISLPAELNDSPTARQILEALPIEGKANTWGDEIYFEINVWTVQAPDAREDVEVGELGYWPTGRAFCIFFGRTPASTGQRPRAYSPVNIVGRTLADSAALRNVQDGDPIRVHLAEHH